MRLSADGELVVIHDPTLERTTNGSGIVRNMTLAHLRAVDAGFRFGPAKYPYRARGINIPTLTEVLDLTSSLTLLIEVKAIEAAEPLLTLLQARREEERATIGSFVAGALVPFRRAGLKTTASFAEVRALLAPAVCRFRRTNLPFSTMSIPPLYHGVPLPVASLARCIAPAGAALDLWTVNDPVDALRFWRSGVRGILTDDPATILEARRQLG